MTREQWRATGRVVEKPNGPGVARSRFHQYEPGFIEVMEDGDYLVSGESDFYTSSLRRAEDYLWDNYAKHEV